MSDQEKETKRGCLECLRSGKFEFDHDTEFGWLEEKGFRKQHADHVLAPGKFPKSARTELRRTPPLACWQQELWLGHCKDFMVYIGTWEPKDFYANAKDKDGRSLFLAMTKPELQHLWDASLKNPNDRLESWHATYYVFRCRHCGVLKGNWDCD